MTLTAWQESWIIQETMRRSTTVANFVSRGPDGCAISRAVSTLEAGIADLRSESWSTEYRQRLIEETRMIGLSLSAARIACSYQGSPPDEPTSGVALSDIMSILGAVGAVPRERIEDAVFDALVQNGRLFERKGNSLESIVLAAQANLTYFGSRSISESLGGLLAGHVILADTLLELLQHMNGQRVVAAFQRPVRSVEHLKAHPFITNFQVIEYSGSQVPVFDVGSITCTVAGGEIVPMPDRDTTFSIRSLLGLGEPAVV